MEFTNQTLLYGLFNQYVFSEAKMNLDYLKMYYKDKRILNNNTLITKLLQLIENYSYIELTESRFMLTLQQDNRTVEEAKMIYDKIHEYQQYDRQQSSVFIENLKSLCYTAFINRVQERYSENPVKYLEELKKFDYKSNYSDTLVAKNFAELDITDLVDRYSAEGFKSRYQFINDSFTCGGYIPGQLVLVAAAPSCFTGDTLIKVYDIVDQMDKSIRMDNLINNKDRYNVYSYDTESKTLIKTEIVDIWESKITTDLIELEFIDGTTIKCTPDHKFLLKDGSYKMAKDLTEDDDIEDNSISNELLSYLVDPDRELISIDHQMEGSYHIIPGNLTLACDSEYPLLGNKYFGIFQQYHNIPARTWSRLLSYRYPDVIYCKLDKESYLNLWLPRYGETWMRGQNRSKEYLIPKEWKCWYDADYWCSRDKMKFTLRLLGITKQDYYDIMTHGNFSERIHRCQCGNYVKFDSLWRGYLQTCGNPECTTATKTKKKFS